jgi:hypothetical protein
MKMNKDSNMLQTSNAHAFKYNTTNAHRILRMMNNPETPYTTRRALRDSLKRIAACTDIDQREYLRVENIAVLLRVAVQHQDSLVWQRAHKAHRKLWETFNAQDRIENPRRWVKFDEVMRAYQERRKAERRPRARRAERPRNIATRRSPVAQQIAA